MRNLFRRFDPRLAAELKSQRKTIIKGLLCVLATSLLTASTIFLVRESVASIEFATPIAVQESRVNNPEKQEDLKDISSTYAAKFVAQAESPQEGQQRALQFLSYVCLIVIGVFGAKYWFTRGQSYFLSQASARLASDLRLRLFKKLQELPISYFNEKRAGAIQSVLTNDVNIYQTAVSIIRDSIDGPVKAVAAFVTVFYFQWQLGLVALAFIPIMVIVIQRNGRKMKAAQRDVQGALSDISTTMHEALQGTRVIKAFNAEEKMQKAYSELVEVGYDKQMRAIRRQASLKPLVEFIGACALALVLFITGWMASKGMLTLADLMALVLALDVINQGARNIASVNNVYNQVQAASDRIYGEVLDVSVEHQDRKGTVIPEKAVGRIEFKNVSFSYPDGTEALKNVSFVIEPGTSLALVGRSGAGKSTIADLLLRFYDPTEGEVLFDGKDVRELDVNWLRSQIGVVPQHTFLFAGSVKENIAIGKPSATTADIEEAAKSAHADEFIRETPNGYETELGERGVRLSGGQMQRVAIARALVRKPAMLLLDEATSALDGHSEKHVQQALEEVMKTRTTLFIAHRLTTAARADKILVLSKGEVVESGSHKELLEANNMYASMYRAFGSGVFDDSMAEAPGL